MTGKVLQLRRDEADIPLPGFTLAKNGIVASASASFEQWEAAGVFIQRAEEAIQWWIGDWLLYGESQTQWGDKYTNAISAFGRDYDTLAAYKAVARDFDFTRRRVNLSYQHHAELRGIEPAKQDELLTEAEPQKGDERPRLSTRELRQKVREVKKGPSVARWSYEEATAKVRELADGCPMGERASFARFLGEMALEIRV